MTFKVPTTLYVPSRSYNLLDDDCPIGWTVKAIPDVKSSAQIVQLVKDYGQVFESKFNCVEYLKQENLI